MCEVLVLEKKPRAERDRLYREKNKDKIHALGKAYRERNKEADKRRKLKWQKENRDKANSYYRNWRKNNSDKVSVIDKIHDGKRRSAKKHTDITPLFLEELKHSTVICEICGNKLIEESPHLDHILPLNIGGKHLKNNVRYVHSHCNLKRPRNGSDLIGTKHEHLLTLI